MTVIEFAPIAKKTASNRRRGNLGNVQARLDEFWAARQAQNSYETRALVN